MITKLHKKKLLALPIPGAASRSINIDINLDNVLDIPSHLNPFSGTPFSVDIEMLKTKGIPDEIRTELMTSIAKIDQLETKIGEIPPELRTYHPESTTSVKLKTVLKSISCQLVKLVGYDDGRDKKSWKKLGNGIDADVDRNVDHIFPKAALSRIALEIQNIDNPELKEVIFSVIGKHSPDFLDQIRDRSEIAKALYNFGPNLCCFTRKRENDDPGDSIDIFPVMTEGNKISTIPKINLYGFQIITDAIMSTYKTDDGKRFDKKSEGEIDIDKFHKQLEIGFKFLAIARVLHKKENMMTRRPTVLTNYCRTNDGCATGSETSFRTPNTSPARPTRRSPARPQLGKVEQLIRAIQINKEHDAFEDTNTLPGNILGAIRGCKQAGINGAQVMSHIEKDLKDAPLLSSAIEQALNPDEGAEPTPERGIEAAGAARRPLDFSTPPPNITNRG